MVGFSKKHQKKVSSEFDHSYNSVSSKEVGGIPEIACTLLNSRHEIDRSAHTKWHPINLKLFSSLHADDQLGGEGKKKSTIE